MPTREKMIERLVQDWLNSIAQEGGNVVETILKKGWAGYENMTDEQVRQDYLGANLDEIHGEDEDGE